MGGIQVKPLKNKSATATRIKSLTVIGLIGIGVTTALSADIRDQLAVQDNLLRFSSATKALEVFKDMKGVIREDLWDIQQQNVDVPVIISFVGTTDANIEKDPTLFYEVDALKSKVIVAIANLQRARTIWGEVSKVRLAIAPWYSHDTSVQNALSSFNSDTKIGGVFDLKCTTVNQSLTLLGGLGGTRELVFPFYRRAYSIYAHEVIEKPNAAVVAGHIAYWDGVLGEFGFGFDHANRPVNDVEGLVLNLTYEEGQNDCEVNQVCDAGGCVLINDDGWKLYNFETPNEDERLNKFETIRYFDGMTENLQKSLKKHKHRPMTDVFNLAKADADAFTGKAVRAGVSVGNKITWSAQNTPSEVAIGTIYMDYEDSNNLGMRTLVLQPLATDEYYTLENLTEEA
jgi:hypothetical protein